MTERKSTAKKIVTARLTEDEYRVLSWIAGLSGRSMASLLHNIVRCYTSAVTKGLSVEGDAGVRFVATRTGRMNDAENVLRKGRA